jgi:hypothetical protein
MDKTGTSAIQYFMHKNRKKFLNDSGICYPNTGLWHDFSHHLFAFSTIGWFGHTEKELFKLFSKMKKELGDVEKTILSSECLFKSPLKENFKILLRLINDQFEQVKVIVYVRRQDKWVESRHRHSIFSGNELPLEKLVRPHFCSYKQFIDHWATVFNPKNIIVKAYEKAQFTDGTIFSDFLSILNLKITDNYEFPPNDVNVSLHNDELDFKQLCNRIGFLSDGADDLNKLLCEHTARTTQIEKAKYLLSPQDRFNLINRYEEVNNSIAKEYLNRQDGKLFYENLPNLTEKWQPYPGINTAKINNISEFIIIHNPQLLIKIAKKIKEAIRSTDPTVAKAGLTLKPLLKIVSNNGNPSWKDRFLRIFK